MLKKTLLLIVLMLVISVSFYKFNNNFHQVIPDKVFRSAQLNAEEFEHVIKLYGIKTVINLRGQNLDKRWYQDEFAVLDKLKITLQDVNFTSSLLPRVDQLHKLVNLLEVSERPLLFHCQFGADRSGLASSVALLIEGETELSEIWEQLSWRYFVIKPNSTGKQFLKKYTKWLDDNDAIHDKYLFIKWVRDYYQDSNNNIYYFIGSINNQTWERPDGNYTNGFKYKLDKSKTKKLFILGWAIDVLKQGGLKKVDVFLDNIPLENVNYGIYLPDLLETFGKEAYLYSGWEAKHDLSKLANGCYDLVLRFVRLDGSSWTPEPQGRLCIQ